MIGFAIIGDQLRQNTHEPTKPGYQEEKTTPVTGDPISEHDALISKASKLGIDTVFKTMAEIKAAIAAKEKGNGG